MKILEISEKNPKEFKVGICIDQDEISDFIKQ